MGKAFIVCGSPASGKSTYGQKLARDTGAVFLDIDTVTERLVKVSLAQSGKREDDRDSGFFKSTYREPIYETLFDVACSNLCRLNVVIAGPFTRELHDSSWPSRLRTRLGSEVEIHYVFCEPSVRRRRLIERKNPRDRLKLEDWDRHKEYYGDEEAPQCADVFIDTTNRNPEAGN